METNNIENLLIVLKNKADEGIAQLADLKVEDEKYAVCLNNLLNTISLIAKFEYTPEPETK